MIEKSTDLLDKEIAKEAFLQKQDSLPGSLVMKERRRARRISEKAEATISPASTDYLDLDKKVARCLTEDISIKGIKIQSEKFLPVNSILKIQLSLRDPTRLINVWGKIRWVRQLKACEVFEMGIEIVGTSKEGLGILKRHIEDSLETVKEKHFSG